MQIRDLFHPSRSEVFLMADGAGTIFDDVRFVQDVLLVALLAFAIDRSEIDPVLESLLHDALKPGQRDPVAKRGALVMTLRAVLGEGRVTAGNFS
jgi:hypothetical protein